MKALALWRKNKINKFSMSDVLLEGYVLFTQQSEKKQVEVLIYLEGLPEGNHGIHIHEKGFSAIRNFENAEDCCNKLGGHFNVGPIWSPENPRGTKHGDHNGDLCYNIFSHDGIAHKKFFTDKISLFDNEKNIIGRSVVIHENEDDEGKGVYEDEEKNIQSFITGNAGKRLACAEIRKIDDSIF